MLQPLVIELISTLTHPETKAFQVFLKGKSRGQELIDFWQVLKSAKASNSLAEIDIQSRKDLAGRLHKLLQEFLVMQELQANELTKQSLFLNALSDRNAPRSVRKVVAKLEHGLEKASIDHTILWATEKIRSDHKFSPRKETGLQVSLGQLYEVRFAIDRLYVHFLELQKAVVFKLEMPTFPKVLRPLIDKYHERKELALLVLLVDSVNDRSTTQVAQIATLYWQTYQVLRRDIACDVLQFLLNSFVLFKSHSNAAMFLLYQWGFETKLLGEKAVLHPAHFKNFLHISFRLRRWDKVDWLLKNFSSSQTSFMVDYARAQQAFYQGETESAYSLLQNLLSTQQAFAKDVYMTTAVHSLIIKLECLKAWQELDESILGFAYDWTPILTRIDSHIAYLNKQNHISSQLLKKALLRFALLKKLIQAKTLQQLEKVYSIVIQKRYDLDDPYWLSYQVQKRMEKTKGYP